MNEEEMKRLAHTLVCELDLLSPEYIYPKIDNFVKSLKTYPHEITIEVNRIVKDYPTYKDALQRMAGWRSYHPAASVSWSHVSPITETSLREAASWRSRPMSIREKQAPPQTSIPWGERTFLNEKGVALYNHGGRAVWPDEIANVINAATQGLNPVEARLWVVLCDDGRVIKGLPVWPR